jgi:hypothetical protein
MGKYLNIAQQVESQQQGTQKHARDVPQAAPIPAAGYTYCPGCRETGLEQQDDRTMCTACAAFWLPSIDLAATSPHATIRVQHRDGRVVLIGIYRCPHCGETRWGPCLENPEVWCCLTCVAQAAGMAGVLPSTEERTTDDRDH